MSATYFVTNTAKRQYLNPTGNAKLHGLLWGFDGNALAHLLAGKFDADSLLDSWAGDPLFLVDDEDDPNSLSALCPNTGGDTRSGYDIVLEDYDDITLNIVASMCQRESVANELFEEAQSSETKFVTLCHIALYLCPPSFVEVFEQRFGKDWRTRYKKEVAKCKWHHPMPMTDDNRKNPRST